MCQKKGLDWHGETKHAPRGGGPAAAFGKAPATVPLQREKPVAVTGAAAVRKTDCEDCCLCVLSHIEYYRFLIKLNGIVNYIFTIIY